MHACIIKVDTEDFTLLLCAVVNNLIGFQKFLLNTACVLGLNINKISSYLSKKNLISFQTSKDVNCGFVDAILQCIRGGHNCIVCTYIE